MSLCTSSASTGLETPDLCRDDKSGGGGGRGKGTLASCTSCQASEVSAQHAKELSWSGAVQMNSRIFEPDCVVKTMDDFIVGCAFSVTSARGTHGWYDQFLEESKNQGRASWLVALCA